MTNERKRAALILTATFIVGIIIGALLPGFVFRARGERGNNERGKMNGNFASRVFRAVRPDSAQKIKIKPFVEMAAVQMDSLESDSRRSADAILDTLSARIKPFLTDDQLSKLKKAYSKRRGGRHEGAEKSEKKKDND